MSLGSLASGGKGAVSIGHGAQFFTDRRSAPLDRLRFAFQHGRQPTGRLGLETE